MLLSGKNQPLHGLKLVIKEEVLPMKDQPEFPALALLAARGLLAPDTWKCKVLKFCHHGVPMVDHYPLLFFPSSVADVALKARSLHESKQEIQIAMTKGPWSRQID